MSDKSSNKKKIDEKEIIDEPRFSKLHTDRRFMKIPSVHKEVKQDPRFAALYTDKRFAFAGEKDIYGRDEEDEESVSYEEEEESELSSDIDSDSEISSDFELPKEEIEYGEETSRLALVNCDFENLKASDLMMIFNSFLPPQGYIKSVCIYPSDFGLKAMEEENKYGPRVWKDPSKISDPNNVEDKGFDVKKLRTYEYNRLKYYFAVIECDSVNTAYHLYKNLDSHEIENTSNKMDLRFIPDDVSFEGRQIKDKAEELPTNYKPPQFETKSVYTTGLHLSWDQTPSDRMFLRRQNFTKEQLRDLDFRAYLADGSSDDESEDGEEKKEKYAKLLEGIDLDDNEEEFKDGMEIVFTSKNIELDEKVKELVDKKLNKDRTVFDELMAKERKKKKEKREKKLAEKYGVEYKIHDSDDEDEGWDRDDYDEKPKKKKKKKNKRKLRESNDDDDDSENESHKPSKKKDKKGTETEIDLTDERFSKLISDPKFHIDPTHPLYKKSKTTEKILKEREKYRKKSRK